MKMRLVQARMLAPDVRLLRFAKANGTALPPQKPGDHVDVLLPNGYVNQYSLCGDPADAAHFTIAVKHLPAGRGGSAWLTRELEVGAIVPVSAPRNHFELEHGRAHTLLLAAGIGITPIVSMATALARRGESFSLHYSTRDPQNAPFARELREIAEGTRFVHHTGPKGGRTAFDARSVLAQHPAGTVVYCCGPQGYMEAVETAASHLPAEDLRFEAFAPLQDDDFVPAPCHVQIASTGRRLEVPAQESLLQGLRREGFRIESKCESGTCGSCEIGYLSGKVIHRDRLLSTRARQSRILPCVSRTNTPVVLDL